MNLRLDGAREEVLEAIRKIPGVTSVRADMEHEGGIFDYEIVMEEGADIRVMLNEMCREHSWSIYRMANDEMTLEDIFMRITMSDEVTEKKKNTPVIRFVTPEEQKAAAEAAKETEEPAQEETSEGAASETPETEGGEE